VGGERVLVVGGGLVGLSTAWFLRRAGAEVIVLERGAPGGGASRGNAGLICPSAVEPLPAPGTIRHALADLTRADAAFHVHPAYAPRMARFLRWFARAGSSDRYEAGLIALSQLGRQVLEAYDELAEAGIGGDASHSGYLMLQDSWQKAEEEHRSIERMASLGLCAQPDEVLEGDELRALEPLLSGSTQAGFVLPGERSIDPSSFVDELVGAVRAEGVEVREQAGAAAVRTTDAGVAIDTPQGPVEGSHAVVAAGVWSAELLGPLHLTLPIFAGKGYSFSLYPDPLPARVVSFGSAHVIATPMGDRLRVAGTMEFDGTTDRFNPRRVDAIVRALTPLVRDVDLQARSEEWVGARPITPDGLPFLGPVPGAERVIVATGHNMLGLTLAPVTGRVVAALVATGDPGIDLSAFAVDRFGR
jgi:D-amino-acid dehydrogenase